MQVWYRIVVLIRLDCPQFVLQVENECRNVIRRATNQVDPAAKVRAGPIQFSNQNRIANYITHDFLSYQAREQSVCGCRCGFKSVQRIWSVRKVAIQYFGEPKVSVT